MCADGFGCSRNLTLQSWIAILFGYSLLSAILWKDLDFGSETGGGLVLVILIVSFRVPLLLRI